MRWMLTSLLAVTLWSPVQAEDAGVTSALPVRRQYSGRIQMHQAPTNALRPVEQEEPSRYKTWALPAAGVTDQGGTVQKMPVAVPARGAAVDTRAEDPFGRTLLNRSDGEGKEKKASGWGWLADDVLKATSRKEPGSGAARESGGEELEETAQDRGSTDIFAPPADLWSAGDHTFSGASSPDSFSRADDAGDDPTVDSMAWQPLGAESMLGGRREPDRPQDGDPLAGREVGSVGFGDPGIVPSEPAVMPSGMARDDELPVASFRSGERGPDDASPFRVGAALVPVVPDEAWGAVSGSREGVGFDATRQDPNALGSLSSVAAYTPVPAPAVFAPAPLLTSPALEGGASSHALGGMGTEMDTRPTTLRW